MFNCHLHLISSIDNAVLILVLFPLSAIRLERVIVDDTRFFVHNHNVVPIYFKDFKFLPKSRNLEKSSCSYDGGIVGGCHGKWIKAVHHLPHQRFNIGTICCVAFTEHDLSAPREDQCWLRPWCLRFSEQFRKVRPHVGVDQDAWTLVENTKGCDKLENAREFLFENYFVESVVDDEWLER